MRSPYGPDAGRAPPALTGAALLAAAALWWIGADYLLRNDPVGAALYAVMGAALLVVGVSAARLAARR